MPAADPMVKDYDTPEQTCLNKTPCSSLTEPSRLSADEDDINYEDEEDEEDGLKREAEECKEKESQDLHDKDLNEDKDVDDDDDETVVPDGGWGWVVCFGSFMVNFILDGTMFSFGILLLDLLDDLGQSKGTTSWAGSALLGFSMMMGPVVSYYLQRYSIRQMTIAGSLLALAGFVVSVFSPNVYLLIVTYGVIGGCGFSMMYMPAIIVVGLYFNKKRAIATGIATSGSGLGTFAYAYITESLLNVYSWRGTILILAGLVFNCAVCGMLFRPLLHGSRKEEEKKKKKKKITKVMHSTEKSKMNREEDESSASSGYSSDDIVPDSPKKIAKVKDKERQQPVENHVSNPSLRTRQVNTTDSDTKEWKPLMNTSAQYETDFPISSQKGGSLGDISSNTDGGNFTEKAKRPHNSPLNTCRSVSQYSMNDKRCTCTDSGMSSAKTSPSRGGDNLSSCSRPHEIVKNVKCEHHPDNDSGRLLRSESSTITSFASETPSSLMDPVPRPKFPKDTTSTSLFHDALMNRYAAKTGNLDVSGTTRTSDSQSGHAHCNCEVPDYKYDTGNQNITIVVSDHQQDVCTECHNNNNVQPLEDGCVRNDTQNKHEDVLQVKGTTNSSRGSRPVSVLLYPSKIEDENTSSITPFVRQYQSAEHLHHLAKGSNPLYYNANELSPLVDIRVLTSEYQLHGVDSGSTERYRQRGKDHRSSHFDPFASRIPSHHSQISKGLLRPMLRKDIYYSGSINHLPAFQQYGSVTSFMAAMTRTSSQAEVNVITSQDHSSSGICCKKVNDLLPWKLFRDAIFILLLITFTTWTAQSVSLTYLPDLAVSLGIPRPDAAFLISVVGISNIMGRVMAGFVTDCLRISSIWLYCMALTLASAVNLTVAFGTSYWLLCVCSGIFGICMGVAVSMRTIVLVEQLGIDVLTESFGVVALFQGIAFTINPPIAGKIIDDLDSFKPPFVMASILYAISGLSCMTVICLGKSRRKECLNVIEAETFSLKSQSDRQSYISAQPAHV